MQLSMLCSNSDSMNQFRVQSGARLSKIGSLTSKSYMCQWTWAMIIRMSLRISLVVMRLLKRTRHLQRDKFRPKLSGSESLEHGWQELLFYIHIASRNYRSIGKLLWSCFELFGAGQVSLSDLTLTFGIVMRSGLSIWMTDLNLMFLSFRRCFMDHLHLLVQNGLPIQHLGSRHRNVRMFLALIGIRGSVKTRTYAQTVVSMASAVSAGVDTEQKTTRNARLHSKLAQEKEELMTTEQVREAKEGPRSLE